MKTRLVLPVLAFVLIVSPVSAETWYVDWKNRQGGDGSSWAEAFIDLREALDRIDDGDEIWLAKGHYRLADGTFEETGNPYPNRFIVEKEVFIRGGFDGFESDPSQRDPLDPTETILDGDRLGDDVTPGSNPADNAGRVVHVQIPLSRVVALEGVTIQGASANGIFWNGVAGTSQELLIYDCRVAFNGNSGVRAHQIDVFIADSLFDSNEIRGLFLSDGNADIENCEITLNESQGIFFDADGERLSITDSSVTFNGREGLRSRSGENHLESSEFSWNEEEGVFFSEADSTECDDCHFVGNGFSGLTATSGSELTVTNCESSGNQMGLKLYNSFATINDCEISRNAINGIGGAIHMENGATMIGNNVLIAENGRGSVGGIRLQRRPSGPGCDLVLANVRFLGNHKTALFIDAANNDFEQHHVILLNPVFVGNVNPDGWGGAILNGGDLSIHHGTFVGNEALGSGDVIAPIFGFFGNSTELVQCLLYDNDASGGDPIDIPHSAANNLDGPRPNFARFPDSGDGDWTTPDDNDYGDLNLGRRSPGIDAGLLQHLPGDWSDLDGDGDQREYLPLDAQLRSRIIGQHPDIGAYESRERNFR